MLSEATSPILPSLPVTDMDADAIAALSYIFCQDRRFDSFEALQLYLTATNPDGLDEVWDEVEDLEYH